MRYVSSSCDRSIPLVKFNVWFLLLEKRVASELNCQAAFVVAQQTCFYLLLKQTRLPKTVKVEPRSALSWCRHLKGDSSFSEWSSSDDFFRKVLIETDPKTRTMAVHWMLSIVYIVYMSPVIKLQIDYVFYNCKLRGLFQPDFPTCNIALAFSRIEGSWNEREQTSTLSFTEL